MQINSIRLMRRFFTPLNIFGASFIFEIIAIGLISTLVVCQIINSIFIILLIGICAQMYFIECYLFDKSSECFDILQSDGLFEIVDKVIESDKNLISIGDRAKKIIFDRGIAEEVYSEHHTLMTYLSAFDIRTVLPREDVEYCIMTFIDHLNKNDKYHFSWSQQNILIDFLSQKRVFEINIGMIMYTSDKAHIIEKQNELKKRNREINQALANLKSN